MFASRAADRGIGRVDVLAFIQHAQPLLYCTIVLLNLLQAETLLRMREGDNFPERGQADNAYFLMSVSGTFSDFANFGIRQPMVNTRTSVIVEHVPVFAEEPNVAVELRQLAHAVQPGEGFGRRAARAASAGAQAAADDDDDHDESDQDGDNNLGGRQSGNGNGSGGNISGQTTKVFGFWTEQQDPRQQE